MKILVTGGNGFIGSHLRERLKNLRHSVSVIDTIGTGFNLDICSPELPGLISQLRPEVVYHLAADNRVTAPVRDTLKSNVIGTFNVLEACRMVKIKQFIFTSSAAVYGDSSRLPIKESWPTRPISAYGISKLADELYCRLFQKYFPSIIFRFANVYGPGQSSSAEGGVAAIFIKRILSGRPITVYGTGRQTRDFVYVADVVDALTAVLGKPRELTVNIGSNQPTSIFRLIKVIEKLTDKTAKITYRPQRPMEIETSLFSYALAEKILNWRPKTGLEQGIDETLNFNPAGS